MLIIDFRGAQACVLGGVPQIQHIPLDFSTAIYAQNSESVTFQVQPLSYHGLIIPIRVMSPQPNSTPARGQALHLDRVFWTWSCEFWYYNQDSSALRCVNLGYFAQLAL